MKHISISPAACLRAVLLAALLGAVALSAGANSPADAAYPGRNGLIVYRSHADETGNDLWTMNPDGTNKTNITNLDGFDHSPSWSNGGGMLAFQSHRGAGDAEIFVSNPDGTNAVNLTNDPNTEDYDPVFSPDNTMIAWARETSSGSDVWVMNIDGSGKHSITGPSFDYRPAWGPNNRIAYGRDGDIWTMDPDGGNQVRLTSLPAGEHEPNWFPDGSKIVYRDDNHGNGEIYVMNADGTGQTRITTNSSWELDPAFSPDGTKIVFTSDRSGNEDIWVMNADGSGPIQLTTNPDDDAIADWQPIPLVGDVDCDGDVDADDALLVSLSVAGLNPVAPCLNAGNTNCDNPLDIVDILPILRYSSDLDAPVPGGCRDVAT